MAGPLITATALVSVAPACDAKTFAPLLQAAADAREINTGLRVSHWLAQLAVESRGFTVFRENLNYSAKRLMEVWPKRFPNLTSTNFCAGNPQALANRVYGGRLGNTDPGDGAKFIGRGFSQLTGRANYKQYGDLIGVDLIGNPDMASDPGVMAQIAAAYWQQHNLNTPADADDIVSITEAWNGGLIGLPERRAALAKFKAALGVLA